MSKRTNKIYSVTVVQYANMAIEASSVEEAIEIAKEYKDEYISDEDFEDSEVDVHSCDSKPSGIGWFEDAKHIFTADGVKSVDEYEDELKAQEN